MESEEILGPQFSVHWSTCSSIPGKRFPITIAFAWLIFAPIMLLGLGGCGDADREPVVSSQEGEESVAEEVAVPALRPSDRIDRLEAAIAAGELTVDEAARYRVYSAFRPELLPEALQGPIDRPSLTPVLRRVHQTWPTLSPETQAELRSYLLPPSDPDSYWRQQLKEAVQEDRRGMGLIAQAWAEEASPTFIYTAADGYQLAIYGLPSVSDTEQAVHRLLTKYRIYEVSRSYGPGAGGLRGTAAARHLR